MNTHELELKTAYWDDPAARNAFKEFMMSIHGLDFSVWESAGFWDDAYTPFSYFHNGDVIASVCMYMLDAVIDGRPSKVTQISGVGTLPQFRRQGLNRRLTDIGLEWIEGKQVGVFLFADAPAIPFYEKCGFEALPDYAECIEVESTDSRGGAVKLDLDRPSHIDLIFDVAQRRAPISRKFGILNPKLVMFHALYLLRDFAFQIPELDCVIFCKRDGERLQIFDILSEEIPPFEQLYPYICDVHDRRVEFYFHTDQLELKSVRIKVLEGNNCYVLPPFPMKNVVFPFTCKA